MVTATKQYQNLLVTKFKTILPQDVEVKAEWPAFKRSEGIYSPRVDVVIGPLAIHDSRKEEYIELFGQYRNLIKELYNCFKSNMRRYSNLNRDVPDLEDIKYFNYNPRCFIAIEIEKSGSRKHLLGDLINASALAQIGIIIPWNDKIFRAFIRQLDYFYFLKKVKKNTFFTKNLLILTRRQFNLVLNTYLRSHGI